jgi:hypothetical protein
VTEIFTTRRIAHQIAAGRVTLHLAPYTAAHEGKLPWRPGHSHAVVPQGKTTLCRVVVLRWRHVTIADLSPREFHDTGHRTRLDLARWWLRTLVTRRERDGRPITDEEVLARFEADHLDRVVWALTMALDTEHQPRMLHEDPAQGYTHLPHRAAQGEPEAVPAFVVERQVDAAHARAASGRGHIEQAHHDEHASLEQRLERVLTRAAARGVDVRDERRAIEQRIHRLERKIGGVA